MPRNTLFAVCTFVVGAVALKALGDSTLAGHALVAAAALAIPGRNGTGGAASGEGAAPSSPAALARTTAAIGVMLLLSFVLGSAARASSGTAAPRPTASELPLGR